MVSKQYAEFPGRICILGFGSIGQGVLPLLLRHIGVSHENVTIVSADPYGADIALKYGVNFIKRKITRANYKEQMSRLIGKGDFLLNLSVDVSSIALIELCREVGALYLDTCIEPWIGGYDEPKLSMAERTNYALREKALKLQTGIPAPTAVVAHGANPGLVSHLLKEALLNLRTDLGMNGKKPTTKEEWAELAQKLGVKVVHIAERDNQRSYIPKQVGEFVNTWSIGGFYAEGNQPAELGWGSHEKYFPADGREHKNGRKSSIYLEQPGILTQVRSWTPLEGAYHGFIITHNESISIADYFTVKDGEGKVTYRPTVHYAYHPCDGAVLSLHEVAGKNGKIQAKHKLIVEEIMPGGVDELGVLLMGHGKGAYWYGSQLSIDQTRVLAPYNNATSLQVAASVLGAFVWAIENPEKGLVEADDIDHTRVLEIAKPYLGIITGEYSKWTPLEGRTPTDSPLFVEDIDESDPWQFKNFRVS
jgi:homospermidine synthase